MNARASNFDVKCRELGDFLRSRRLHLDPEVLGLPVERRRRTPGLRREEVAERAGIGTDWYVRLEQGRDVRPSVTTIDALARALVLSEAERAHLHALARTGKRPAFARESVPPALDRILQDLAVPAYVTGQRWDILSWNSIAAELFGDFGTMPEDRRNILVYMLAEPRAKNLFGETWAGEAARMVVQFRSDFGLWAGDPAFDELITLLRTESVEFNKFWDEHGVRGQAIGKKKLQHSRDDVVMVEYATLQSNDDRRLKLVLYRFLNSATTVAAKL
jgi:transcriptional regulator with XRE-family HTH domain